MPEGAEATQRARAFAARAVGGCAVLPSRVVDVAQWPAQAYFRSRATRARFFPLAGS